MTNIEAMTIGALARLEHQLNQDVQRHLREMRQKANIFMLTNLPVKRIEGIRLLPSCGGVTTIVVGGSGGSCGPTSGGGGGWWFR